MGAPFGTSWNLNEFSSNFPGALWNFVMLPLAMATPPSFGHYIPQLATSWSARPSEVTVHLRPSAKWQDGQAFTSQDVITSLMLQGVNGNNIWHDLTKVTAPNAHTVVLYLKPKMPSQIVLSDLLGMTPVSNSQYGQFVPPHLMSDLLSYYTPSQPDLNSAAGKVITTADKRLVAFSPKTLDGDGPFEFVSGTSAVMSTKRWPGFWDAKNIHMSGYTEDAFSSNAVEYGALFSQRVDLAQAGMSGDVLSRWEHTPNAHLNIKNNYTGFSFYFNEKQYPFGLLAVRKAIAHLINRPSLNLLSHGGKSIYTAVAYPDGLLHTIEYAYLTKAQIHSLNPYPDDPSKAASLLRSAGFHKKGKWWYMPNGKQFITSIDGPAGWGGPTLAIEIVARWLTSFGIKATADAVEQPGYWTYQDDGHYQIDWGWFGSNGLDPLANFEDDLATYNYISPTEPGFAFGPMVNVPGLGKVNVPATIKTEAATINPLPTPQVKKLVWDWARLINEQLPILPFSDKNQGVQYSTVHFTDWPPASSSIWPLMGYNFNGAAVVALERGYIRPK